MRTYAVFLAVFLSGCVSAPVHYYSVDEVLASPAQFNGRTISVCGWFEVDMETCTLSGSSGLQEIWVVPRSDVCVPDNWFKEPHGRWAVVDGTFYTGESYGHLGTYDHALAGGKPKPIRGKCQFPGSAPNNSFKPKPLRGSA